ncbi:MAG TPA: carboxypeptidase regulatory-like domain-containing protein [Vicinamibacterales bacterium]|nr:carboxypeptidase regulatory-like domain-containing protein [Vicinamibacterales bacterium]
MPRCVKAVVLVVSLVLLPGMALAQTSASIVGTAKDASGAVLPGVTVEAASPALIEKTRTVVTNGAGQFAIEDLRPGTYTVTFTLAGFSTIKREGIQLTGSFVATVNADMKVGGVAETIVVTGEAPTVDVTSTRNEEVLSGQTVTEIPSSRQYSAFTHLIPAINVQQNDFEGSNPALYSVFQIHGGRRNEGQVLVDGMNGGYQGMGVSGYVPEVGNAQEVVFSLSGGLGEATTGGPQMNIITKQGGNRFAGTYFMSGTGNALQGNNLTPDVQAKGLTATNGIQKLWEVNPSLGGPIVRDRLWFFFTYRYQLSDQNVASMWVNKNAGNPNTWTYAPDYGQQAVTDGVWKQSNARVTWQATPRNKINFWNSVQYSCIGCTGGGDGTGLGFGASIRSPEAYTTNENHPSMMTQVSWQSPVTSRLLLDMDAQIGPYFWWGSRQKNAYDTTMIPVTETAGIIPNLNYRAENWSGHKGYTNIVQGSASYITGSHSTKFGFRLHQNIADYPVNFYNNTQLAYQFTNGAPSAVTVNGDQNAHQEQHQFMVALYAQDRWTLKRLSLQGGLRFEHLGDYFPQQSMGPNVFLPNAIIFPAQDGPLSQKDLMPRFGASYDVFGDGKTAVKAFLGRYVTTFNTVDEWANYSPAGLGHFVSQDQNRPWSDANGDFVVNCNLLNPAANGECGPGNPSFLKTTSPLTTDPALTNGWNSREYSWDFNVGVTQQLAPRVSAEVDYYRRSWGNLTAEVNRAWTPADFTPFTYAVPSDPRLPGGGGYNLTFQDINPGAYTRTPDNFLTFSDNVGGAYNKFNGVDFSVNARLSALTLQGGTSSGNDIEDSCGVVSQHPEYYIFGPWGGTGGFLDTFLGGLGQWPQQFCHRESGWQTNVKGLATYTVPRVDVLISGTFRSLPFAGNEFPSIQSQSLGGQALALNIPAIGLVDPSLKLNRAFGSGQAVEFFNIVQPGTLYGDRLNSVDLRLGKIFKHGTTRTQINLDVYNLFNSNTTEVYQRNYTAPGPTSTYLNPLSIMSARFFKISGQFDF